MKKTASVLLGLLALHVAPLTSHATTLGLPDPNFGTLWDTFPSVSFSNIPGTGTNPFMSATLSSTSGDGMIVAAGDLLYSGAGGGTANVDLTINGTAAIALDSIVMYMKYTPASGSGQLEGYFTVTLDGVAPTQHGLGGTGEVNFGQEMNVVQFTWTGLNIDASDTFAITISRPAAAPGEPGHVVIDAVQVVPEPTTAVLALLGLGFAVLRRRRNVASVAEASHFA